MRCLTKFLRGFGSLGAVLGAMCAALWPLRGFADSPAEGPVGADKSGYSLFNPTPDALMRELSPDRPDKTESPYTVDAGHFQLEMDFANFTRSDEKGARTDTWNIAPFNFKIGLSNHTDLQLVFEDLLRVRTQAPTGPSPTQLGVGDLTARLKVNLWGDDAGGTALALLPFVKFPTNSGGLGNGSVEGGVIVPLSVKLPAGWELGLETAASLLRHPDRRGYHGDFIGSVTCDHAIFGRLNGYLEFFGEISAEHAAGWIGTVDGGLEYALSGNVQLDCGCNVGVTRAADAANPFTGITVRF